MAKKPPGYYCSFCRKSYKDVGPLAEGEEQVYICYNCVLLSKNIIETARQRLGIKSDDNEGTSTRS
jgi:hypothetical protein